MIAWLLSSLAFGGVEVGATAGVVLAEQSAGDGLEGAGAASLYTGMGLFEYFRGEAHLGYTGLGGVEGVNAVEVESRSGDLRLLVGVSFPAFSVPKVELGGDLLVGPDIRVTHVRTEILGMDTSSLALSVHPSVALGPYAELGLARVGLRVWGDLPKEGRLGFSAIGGLRF